MGTNFLIASKMLLALLVTAVSVVLLLSIFVPQAQANPPRGFPLYSWGDNRDNRLGRTPTLTNPHNVPGRVGDRNDWVLVASAAGGSKGIDTQGRLWTWGPTGDQRGLGAGTTQRSEPYRILMPPGNVSCTYYWVHVASLANVVAAVTDEGHLYTWGINTQGRLGHGHSDAVNVPTRLYIGPTAAECDTFFTQVSVGTSAGGLTLALTDEGYIYSWGPTGATGVGRPTNVIPANRPGRVTNPQGVPLGNWAQVESGLSQSGKAICRNGFLYSWAGASNSAGLGRDVTAAAPHDRPGRVGNLSNVVDVVMTQGNAAAVTRNPATGEGYLYTWGGTAAPLGRAHDAASPANRPGRIEGDNWTAVMGGWQHFIAITRQNQIFSWGMNNTTGPGYTGQLGLGLDSNGNHILQVNRPTSVGYIIGAAGAARGGGGHSLALMDEFSLTPATAAFAINKDLRKLQSTTLPSDLTFEFAIVPYSFDGNPALANQLPAIPNANRSVTITAASDSETAGGVITLTEYTDFLRDVDFEAAGVFAWMISEVENSSSTNTNPPSNLRVSYSQVRYEVRVTVEEDGVEFDVTTIALLRHVDAQGNPIVPPLTIANHGNEVTFTGSFQTWSSGTNTCTGALTVSKEIDGDFVDPVTPFTFEVTLTGTALCVAGTEFTARVYGPNNNFIRTETFEVNETEDIILLDEQTLVFPYLPVGLTWEVEELELLEFTAALELTVNGVTNPRVTNPHPQLDLSTGTHTITAENLRNSAHFINIHFITPPMGLVIGNGAASIVVAAAGLLVVTLLALKVRRRSEKGNAELERLDLFKP